MNRLGRTKDLLEKLGAGPKKALGQNFLVSDTVVDRIIEAAKHFKPQTLIEIGPGLGALTFDLKQITGDYTLIELDRVFADFWRQEGLSVVEADALQLDWTQIAAKPGTVLVSNLPYQISSSIVIDRTIGPDTIDAMVLMFQKEVAQRIKAKAKTDHYGLLSVIAQVYWQVETVCDAGPRDFFPPPKIISRVLSFKRKKQELPAREKFLNFVKLAFQHRRKLMASNLQGLNKGQAVKKWLEQNGFSEKARAEELSPEQFVELFNFMGRQ